MKTLYFDTETTGVKDSEICQLSYIIDNGIEIYGKNFFFSVQDMNPIAQGIHGFSKEMLEELSEGKTFYDHIDEIDSDFSDVDLLIAHNATFDIGMMRKEYSRIGRAFNVCRYLCSMKYMTPHLKIPKTFGGGYKYPSLSELVSYYIQDHSLIVEYVYSLFDARVGYHDARYDTVSLYLAINAATKCIDVLKEQVCNIV